MQANYTTNKSSTKKQKQTNISYEDIEVESDIQESRPNGIQKSNIRDFEKNMMSPLQKDANENPNKFKEANPQYSLDSDEDEE